MVGIKIDANNKIIMALSLFLSFFFIQKYFKIAMPKLLIKPILINTPTKRS